MREKEKQNDLKTKKISENKKKIIQNNFLILSLTKIYDKKIFNFFNT